MKSSTAIILLRKFILFGLTCLLFSHVQAQPFYFDHFQVEEGLSNNAVFCSVQDRNGFLWFGTRDGLNRFDGYTFKIYQNRPEKSRSPQSNFVRVLMEDKQSILWVGTDQGIFLFDPRTEKFKFFNHSLSGEILDIKQAADGDVWFISDMNLYRYDLRRDTMLMITQNHRTCSITLDERRNGIWTGTSDGWVHQLSKDGKILVSYQVFKNTPLVQDRWIERLLFSAQNKLLIGTRKHGIKLLETDRDTYRDLLSSDYKHETIFIRDILNKQGSLFWFASESGIIQYDLSNDKYEYITKVKDDPWSLSDNAVYTLLKDAEGSIWAGTYFGGLNYFSERNTFFEKFYPTDNPGSIKGYAVREITKDKYGKIWIGTEDHGLTRYDPFKKSFVHFSPSAEKGSISHSNIHGLLASGDTLWIGTFEHGLDLMNVRTGRVFKHFDASDKKGSLGNNFILNIIKKKDGNILLATGRGLYEFDQKKKEFLLMNYFPGYIFFTTLFEDSNGVIWAGTWRDGLYYYNQHTGETGSMTFAANESRSLRSNRINRIFEDSNKSIWVATEGGLSRLNKDFKSFTNYTTANGFPSNLILSMLEDDQGVLWISTTKGMVRFTPSGEVRVLTKANGLLSNQFNYNSSFKDDNGLLYFGSVKGMIRFDPAKYMETRGKAPVYITGLQINNREVQIGTKGSPLDSAVSFTEKITLNHKQSTFSIDFAALSFVAPTMTEYAYKMEGLDKEWNHLQTNRKVYFTDLSPGNYTFRVNVVNATGDFIGKERKLSISVLPPLWASMPAYLSYLLLCLLIIFFIVRGYDKRVKDRNRRRLDYLKYQREKSLYQAKIDFFTQIVHEIRTPLTMIKAPLEKVMMSNHSGPDVAKNLKLIEKSTNRLITLSGQLLDFRKVETGSFIPSFKNINVNEILLENYRVFQSIHQQKGITFELDMAAKIEAELDEEALVKIIVNLMDNATKYCESFVKVEIQRVADDALNFRILFINDGLPVPEHLRKKIFEPFYRVKKEVYKQGTGIGLALSQSLAALLNGGLKFEVSKNGYNVFILTLPLKQCYHE